MYLTLKHTHVGYKSTTRYRRGRLENWRGGVFEADTNDWRDIGQGPSERVVQTGSSEQQDIDK